MENEGQLAGSIHLGQFLARLDCSEISCKGILTEFIDQRLDLGIARFLVAKVVPLYRRIGISE